MTRLGRGYQWFRFGVSLFLGSFPLHTIVSHPHKYVRTNTSLLPALIPKVSVCGVECAASSSECAEGQEPVIPVIFPYSQLERLGTAPRHESDVQNTKSRVRWYCYFIFFISSCPLRFAHVTSNKVFFNVLARSSFVATPRANERASSI
ncbi:hypothetical protein EJ02DRAFT_75532 [Clathrospora elynae]|uniref:Uncharacterized protein n=1 Tax=Clathrospora elynae TaxID=706981 RepID=A0A6A5SAQ6_9PLEO|nr:hypothetical protein EJ02DRAFT_75532 [Clathrospora elynae]